MTKIFHILPLGLDLEEVLVIRDDSHSQYFTRLMNQVLVDHLFQDMTILVLREKTLYMDGSLFQPLDILGRHFVLILHLGWTFAAWIIFADVVELLALHDCVHSSGFKFQAEHRSESGHREYKSKNDLYPARIVTKSILVSEQYFDQELVSRLLSSILGIIEVETLPKAGEKGSKSNEDQKLENTSLEVQI